MHVKASILAAVIALLVAPLRMAADCSSTAVVQAPATACKSGTATVAVIPIPGATYAWSVQGGAIVSGAGSDKITISLGTSASATVSVTATAGNCVAQGSAAIALHDPFGVRAVIPASHAGEPLTIAWSYENGSPAQQTISGTDFGVLPLAPEARSYSYLPGASGSKQIVIDATMQQTTTTTPSSVSRRRAVAATPATASACANAHLSTQYDVGACIEPPVSVDAPASVVAGTEFELRVDPQPGAVATWTIQNGSPAAATGNSVMVTAGSEGRIDFSVSLVRGACVGQLNRSVGITAKAVCNHPTAVVSAGPIACGSATINATFTGTPPFHTVWSDNTSFTTNAMSLTRTTNTTGNYSILGFEDAACAGTSSGVASFSWLSPTATIVGKANSCVGHDSVTVQFTGKPPFWGGWSDFTSFNTNEMQLVKAITEEGYNTLSYGYDATDCKLTVLGGVQGRTTPRVHAARWCQPPAFGNVVQVYADFTTFFINPLTAVWSDGVTKSGDGNPIYRFEKPQQTTTYTIVSAHDAYCSAVIEAPQSVTIYASPEPDFILGIGDICSGAAATASLATPPPGDAAVHWFIEGDGSIVSGQGTSSLQYKAGAAGTMVVGCTFTFPDDRCPMSTRRSVRVDNDPVGTISLEKPQIHKGETVLITFTLDSATWYWNLKDSLNDEITPQGVCGPHMTCQALYTSSRSAGKSTINLVLTGFCNNTKTVSAELSILP